MVKIQILGGPSSGKTTLAQALSARFHVPHYDLDRIGWTHRTDMIAHIDEAIAIAERPEWIVEGIHIIRIFLASKSSYVVGRCAIKTNSRPRRSGASRTSSRDIPTILSELVISSRLLKRNVESDVITVPSLSKIYVHRKDTKEF